MKIWGIGQISPEEKTDILSKHREIYDGYRTLQSKVPNEQPLYVQDFAKDKVGAVLNNKGVAKPYTNFGINEQYLNNIGIKAPTPPKAKKAISKIENMEEISEGAECSECGGMMAEGECMECGYKSQMQEISSREIGDKFKKVMTGKKIDKKIPYIADAVQSIIGYIKSSKTEKQLESAMNVFKNLKDMTEDFNQAYEERIISVFKRKADELGNYLKKSEHTESEETFEQKEDDDSDDFYYVDYTMGNEDDPNMIPNPPKELYIDMSSKKSEKPSFRPGVDLGKSFEKFKGMYEGTGKLSDIYNVEDLGDSDFDYVEGGGNDYGTFEKMHHMKKIKNEGMYEDPDNEDDGFEDIQADEQMEDMEFEKGKKYKYRTPSFSDELEYEEEIPVDIDKMLKFKGKEYHHLLPKKGIEKYIEKEMSEQGYTGGGNAPDMDISNIKPAYDFVSDGPGEVYPESEMDEQCLDCVKEYETMESAWFSDELEEANDISGVQGVYGDMKKAYDFDSEGPGKAGPYQTSSWNEQEDEDEGYEEDELEVNFDEFDPRDKSWEEITAHTGDDEFAHVDEDIKESFIQQKNKITEMFTRMKKYN